MKDYRYWLLATSYTVFATASPSLLRRATLDECLDSLQVPVYASGSKNYTQAIKPFNLRVPFKPAAYAVPTSLEHIQNAISCGVKSGIQVTAKSGGHSYGSHGLGGEDGHLIVDMRHFNSVTVDQEAHTTVVGSGGRLGNIALALYEQGNQATSHGTCPGVGVGGLTLHGGYGLISRLKGLTLDNLLEATVVLANSTVVTASDTQNSDLFWALRGAGAAFGIVSSFKFKTFTAPENNLVFNYNLSPSSATQLANVLTILQNFTIQTQPAELNMRIFLPAQLTGVYYGNRSEFDRVITPLLTQLGEATTGRAVVGSVSAKSWLNTLTSFSNGPLAQAEVYDTHENFYAKSLMPAFLSPAAITALSEYYYTTARRITRGWYLLIDMHGGAGSAVTSIPPDATAYAHRNATFKMQFYDALFSNSATYNPEWFSFLNEWVKAIEDASPETQFGMYVNYADTNLTKEEAHSHYWGAHYEKLVGIKAKYDPGRVFEGPQLVGS